VTVHGEIDIANHHLFAMVVDAVTNHVGDADTPQGEAHLDLADLDFIDVGGARVLVTAAAKRGPDDQLVIHHPPAMLVRILQVGWGQLPGLRLEQ
jgi:anti-anti-sigma factor